MYILKMLLSLTIYTSIFKAEKASRIWRVQTKAIIPLFVLSVSLQTINVTLFISKITQNLSSA